MEASVHGITAPSAVYEIRGRRFEVGSRGFAEAIADAHAAHHRPRCMCLGEGVEMYVARLAGSNRGYIVKRMPDTGSHHAVECPSYEPPAAFSGLGQVLGSAITEDTATGETTLKLDFALTKMPGRAGKPPTGKDGDSVCTDGTRLSLRGLLHYLWDQAELTRWHPGFAGKRTWATVRRHLLQAAEQKVASGESLLTRLYIPEPFSIEQRDAINARRLTQWQRALADPGKPRRLMLLICEIKEIVPARYGFKAVVKHLPDQAFALDEELYRRLGRRFEAELALWGSTEDIHLVMVATFGVSSAGIPAIQELSLMPVTRQWLPVEDGFAMQLVSRLVNEARSFVKGMHYNLGRNEPIACAALTDCEGPTRMLFVHPEASNDSRIEVEETVTSETAWVWHTSRESMPLLPSPARR